MNKINILLAIIISLLGALQAEGNSIESEIQLILKAHTQSPNFCDWDTNPLNPKYSINNLVAQFGEKNVCEALSQIPSEKLLLFEGVFDDNENTQSSISCSPDVLGRIYNFLREKKEEIIKETEIAEAHKSKKFGFKYTNHLKSKKKVLGPSLKIQLDTKSEHKFVFADLPKKYIALTFDDGPHSKYTPQLLNILEAYDVQSVFFVVGEKVQKHPLIASDIEKRGHILGNHSMSHKNLKKVSNEQGLYEIQAGFDTLFDISERVSPFFRFPYGNHTPFLRQSLETNDIGEFFWSIDTLDWKITDPKKLYDHVIKQVLKNSRGIVLFHDIHPQTVAMMPQFLEFLIENQFQTVLLTPKDYLQKGIQH